jgi:hypothetical protein
MEGKCLKDRPAIALLARSWARERKSMMVRFCIRREITGWGRGAATASLCALSSSLAAMRKGEQQQQQRSH